MGEAGMVAAVPADVTGALAAAAAGSVGRGATGASMDIAEAAAASEAAWSGLSGSGGKYGAGGLGCGVGRAISVDICVDFTCTVVGDCRKGAEAERSRSIRSCCAASDARRWVAGESSGCRREAPCCSREVDERCLDGCCDDDMLKSRYPEPHVQLIELQLYQVVDTKGVVLISGALIIGCDCRRRRLRRNALA